MEFDRGDLVVVPGCGVGLVEAVETVELGDAPVQTYRIDLGEEAGRLWIPVDRTSEEGLRPPMDRDDVEQTWTLIRRRETPAGKRAHWNQRRRRYLEMLMSNQPHKLARLIGELVEVRSRKQGKREVLSFEERRILERAKRLVVREIAASTGQEPEDVRATLVELIAAGAQPSPA